MIPWSTAAPAVGAAFAASLVEVVEAFTIVLAVAMIRGWRPAMLGTGAALALLGGSVALLGPLLAQVPIHALQLAVGTLLLLFGMSWLRKAALRRGGAIPLHDEEAIFASETAQFGDAARRQTRLDWLAGMTAMKAVLLEGLEVVFIVVAVGMAGGLLVPAAAGAALACAVVLAIGAIVHRPLARVPENTLKFGVGVMLSAFGVFWTGEGLGIAWPGQDLALPVFAAVFLGAGLAASSLARGAVLRRLA